MSRGGDRVNRDGNISLGCSVQGTIVKGYKAKGTGNREQGSYLTDSTGGMRTLDFFCHD